MFKVLRNLCLKLIFYFQIFLFSKTWEVVRVPGNYIIYVSRWWFQIFFSFSSLPREMIQFDFRIFFKWVGEKPPTSSKKKSHQTGKRLAHHFPKATGHAGWKWRDWRALDRRAAGRPRLFEVPNTTSATFFAPKIWWEWHGFWGWRNRFMRTKVEETRWCCFPSFFFVMVPLLVVAVSFQASKTRLLLM